MARRRSITIAAVVGLVAAVGVVAAALLAAAFDDDPGSADSNRGAPLASFDEVETGVALMEALDCDGNPLVVGDGDSEHPVRGTGFLVGSRLLMGVEHMIPQRAYGMICGFRARLGGRWYDVVGVKVWSERGKE